MSVKERTRNLKPLPAFASDAEAERFVERANLAAYDLSKGRTARFEFERKTAQINLRISQGLLRSVKARAKRRGIPYQRFIRETLEKAVN